MIFYQLYVPFEVEEKLKHQLVEKKIDKGREV